jgi:predicted RNA-binding Zn-ribbon protein involved in translation (DUF1610 family)
MSLFKNHTDLVEQKLTKSSEKDKSKPQKKNGFEERTTLDMYHRTQLDTIKVKIQDISGLYLERDGLVDLINVCNDEILVGQYETRLHMIEKEIASLKDDRPIYDYFLKTGGILFNYYDIQDKIASGEVTEKSKHSKSKPGNILSVLTEAAKKDGIYIEDTIPTTTTIPAQGRETLLEQYLEIVDGNFKKKAVSEIEEATGDCKFCGEEMIFSSNEALFNCPECGNQEFILMDSDRPSYKDPPRETSYYAYKRINHFNELLAQFQAKESTDIPQEVFDNILIELKKERITDINNLKIPKLREILRKLKYNKYYEHIPTIIYRLNGNNAPIMNRETEEKLRHMFKEIQPSFQKHCPKTRRNFLSYHYVLYKFCELLEMDEFLHCFPLLKNRDKLYQQDNIWKLICIDMAWEFIRSV